MAELIVRQGDITEIRVDAIVNAANRRLMGGGGVDGATHAAGGPAIMVECDWIRAEKGGCETGEAVMTTAGGLPAKAVIHTVGPVWHNGRENEAGLLANCYRNCLTLADEKRMKSISFPNISTGVYGYPKDRAARIAVNAVKEYVSNSGTGLAKILFVCFDDENTRIYISLLERV